MKIWFIISLLLQGAQSAPLQRRERIPIVVNESINPVLMPSLFRIESILSESSKQGFLNEWSALESHLKAGIREIVLHSNINAYCGISTPHKVKGCARSDQNIIYLDSVYRYGDLRHEAIHIYSYQNNRVFSEMFESIYQEEGQRIAVQQGNVHTIYEYFVSAYLLYLDNPSYLQSVCVKTYAYFSQL